MQFDPPAPEMQPLDRGFVIDHGHDDLAVVGRGLAADDGDVARQDARADHAFAAYAQGEQFGPGGRRRNRQVAFRIFDRRGQRAGLHLAEQRNQREAGRERQSKAA